ncbi:putative ferric-chelate reductase 1 [Misgurnus anguillicaudatus]|uniref:putative ferric-chelate reductase 1 n=1 Tax=Misgurnus anguillicaudatus TaxID=75329 RepID=UPI003CCF63C6
MLLYILLSACVGTVHLYSHGVVTSACSSMSPNHDGASSQTSSPPYTVTAVPTSFKEGDEITVTLRAVSGDFEGFMLQARRVETSIPIGTFTVTNTAEAQGLTCSEVANTAVSHNSDSEKTEIIVKWKAPTSGPLSNVEFRATFVKNKATFWEGVKSSAITYTGTSTPVTAAPTLPTSNSGCGKSKVCFSQPDNCDPTTNTDCHFVSVQSSSQSEMQVQIVGPGSGYVAIGFSDDQAMGNDDIYICGKDKDGIPQVQRAFSTGKKTPNIVSLGNISDIKTSITNGVFNCSFTSRNVISTASRASGSQYYLMIASGPASQGSIQEHTKKFVTQDKADLLNPTVIKSEAEAYPAIVKAHGALMLIAWMTTGSVGMLIARYLKAVGKGRGCCGKDFWFLAHVTLMSLSIIATAIAFIIVFSYAQDWAGGAHPVLGCLVMILSLIQPIVAALRCDPQHEKRFIFNWAHSFNALAIKGLAVGAIFTGLELIGEAQGEGWMLGVMGGFVAWEALLYVLQDLHMRARKKDSTICSFGMMNTEVFLLVVYILGNLAFLIALLVGIGKA